MRPRDEAFEPLDVDRRRRNEPRTLPRSTSPRTAPARRDAQLAKHDARPGQRRQLDAPVSRRRLGDQRLQRRQLAVAPMLIGHLLHDYFAFDFPWPPITVPHTMLSPRSWCPRRCCRRRRRAPDDVVALRRCCPTDVPTRVRSRRRWRPQSSTGAPHDVVIVAPTPSPRRCCRLVDRAPDDVGAPHDVADVRPRLPS